MVCGGEYRSLSFVGKMIVTREEPYMLTITTVLQGHVYMETQFFVKQLAPHSPSVTSSRYGRRECMQFLALMEA